MLTVTETTWWKLSDLRAEAPDSKYPLAIVSFEDRRRKAFEELRRPTFSGSCVRLHGVIRFLGDGKVCEISETSTNAKNFDNNVWWQLAKAFRSFNTRDLAVFEIGAFNRHANRVAIDE